MPITPLPLAALMEMPSLPLAEPVLIVAAVLLLVLLLAAFDRIRRREQLDPAVATRLGSQYA